MKMKAKYKISALHITVTFFKYFNPIIYKNQIYVCFDLLLRILVYNPPFIQFHNFSKIYSFLILSRQQNSEKILILANLCLYYY